MVPCAAHGAYFNACRTMSVHTTLFSAEEHEISLILQHILQNQMPQSVIYTDFLSVVRTLSSYKQQSPRRKLRVQPSTVDGGVREIFFPATLH